MIYVFGRYTADGVEATRFSFVSALRCVLTINGLFFLGQNNARTPCNTHMFVMK